MPDILIRNIDEETLNALKKRASDNNHSLQSELHKMIRSYTHTDLSEFRDLVREVQDEYIAANKTLSDSTELIKSDRER